MIPLILLGICLSGFALVFLHWALAESRRAPTLSDADTTDGEKHSDQTKPGALQRALSGTSR